MDKQLSLFDSVDEKGSDLYSKVQEVIDKIIDSHNLPPKSIHLYSNVSNKGKKAGTEISKSICIYEPAYPKGAYGKDTPGRNSTILNIKQMKSKVELKIKDTQFDMVDMPESAEVKVLQSAPGFHFVDFALDDDSIYEYIEKNIIYCLANYKSSNSFGCCSHFIECSDAKNVYMKIKYIQWDANIGRILKPAGYSMEKTKIYDFICI